LWCTTTTGTILIITYQFALKIPTETKQQQQQQQKKPAAATGYRNFHLWLCTPSGSEKKRTMVKKTIIHNEKSHHQLLLGKFCNGKQKKMQKSRISPQYIHPSPTNVFGTLNFPDKTRKTANVLKTKRERREIPFSIDCLRLLVFSTKAHFQTKAELAVVGEEVFGTLIKQMISTDIL
jgi:hypothetical protein